MKSLFSVRASWILLSSVALLTMSLGCVSKKKAALQQEQAFFLGQQQAAARNQPAPRQVFFRGNVRHVALDYREEMTLAEGILEAEYTGRQTPRFIQIKSWKGELIDIDPRTLLRGEDYFLEPGDQVEIRRR